MKKNFLFSLRSLCFLILTLFFSCSSPEETWEVSFNFEDTKGELPSDQIQRTKISPSYLKAVYKKNKATPNYIKFKKADELFLSKSSGYKNFLSGNSQQNADSEKLAEEVLHKIRDTYNTEKNSFHFEEFSGNLTNGRIKFRQYLGKFKIYSSVLNIHLKDHSIFLIHGNTFDSPIIINKRMITLSDAKDIVENHEKSSNNQIHLAEELLFPVNEQELLHALAIYYSQKGTPSAYKLIINAENGELLEKQNLLHFLNPKATVYKYDPVDGPLVQVELTNLISEDQLKSDTLHVINSDATGGTPSPEKGPEGNYIYKENDKEIEMLNVYYWINFLYDFYLANYEMPKGVSSEKEKFYGVNFITSYKGNGFANQAAYTPIFDPLNNGQKRPSFLFSPGSDVRKPTALCSDAIFHEFNHWVTDRITSMGDNLEARALHEGYSDFFAVSITHNPKLYKYFVLGSELESLRNISSGEKYRRPIPSALMDVYALSGTWSHALWLSQNKFSEVYKTYQINNEESNPLFKKGDELFARIAHKSRFYLDDSTSDMRSAYEALLNADEQLYKSKHQIKIIEAMENQGFSVIGAEKTVSLTPISAISAPKTCYMNFNNKLDGSYSFTEISGKKEPALSFFWEVLDRPEGSKYQIKDPFLKSFNFIPDTIGSYKIQLTVSDINYNLSSPAVIELNAVNEEPPPEIINTTTTNQPTHQTQDTQNQSQTSYTSVQSFSSTSENESSTSTDSTTYTTSPSCNLSTKQPDKENYLFFCLICFLYLTIRRIRVF